MKVSDTALKLAFFGMKHEASDIIDYLAIHFSVIVSTLVGVVAAIWIGHVVDMPVGLVAGIGFYGFSMVLCSYMLLHNVGNSCWSQQRPHYEHSEEASGRRKRTA